MASKKAKVSAEPRAESSTSLDEGTLQVEDAKESVVLESTPSKTTPNGEMQSSEEQPDPVSKKKAKQSVSASTEIAKSQASDKGVKMKRLTLDISKTLHKAIKAKAVEEGIPMVDMLRTLLEEHYGR